MTPVQILKGTYKWNDTLTRLPIDNPMGLDFESTVVDGDTTTTFTFNRLQNSGNYIQFYVTKVNNSTEDSRVDTFINVYNLSTNRWEWELQDFTVIYPMTYDETLGNWFNSNTTAISVEPEPEEPEEPDTPDTPDVPDTPDTETPTLDSIIAKLQNLIKKANTTTGKSDTDLTSGVNSLIEGYGVGSEIPNGYIKPSGNLSITENGSYDVTEKASVTVNVANSGGGECDRNHIIEVDTLPTENIDENALYKMEDSYYKYEQALKNIYAVAYGQQISFVDIYIGQGFTVELYYVTTKPTTDIKEYSEATMYAPVYYVEDENDCFVYVSGTWVSLSAELQMQNGGAITDISQATANYHYYALVDNGWKSYTVVSGSIEINENTTVDVRTKAEVVVNVPNVIPDGYIKPSGSLEITENGTFDVTDKASVTVAIPEYDGTVVVE